MRPSAPVVDDLLPPKDLSHHFSEVTKRRTPSSIKEFYRFFTIPKIGNLGGGMLSPPRCSQVSPFSVVAEGLGNMSF